MPNAVTVGLLLNYYYLTDEPSVVTSKALQEAKVFLLKHGLIEEDEDHGVLEITDKGIYWVKFVLTKCPLPQEVSSYKVCVVADAA